MCTDAHQNNLFSVQPVQLRDKIKIFQCKGEKQISLFNSAFRQTGKAVISLHRYGG